MWQKVAKFKGAEYFRKALYIHAYILYNHYRKMGTGTLINAPIDTPAEAFIKIVGAFISV